MRRGLVKKLHFKCAAGILVLISMCLGSMVWAGGDLPSGMPDNLSDMSPYFPCMDKLCCEPPPRSPWYFRTDSMLLKRDRMDPVPIATLGPGVFIGEPLPENLAFSTRELASPFRAGPKFTFGRTLGSSRWQLDTTWFWVDNWLDEVGVRNNNINVLGSLGNLYSPFSNFGNPFGFAGFDFNDFVAVREFSQFRSGEFNLRYTLPMPHCCLTPKLIIGLRYIDVQERFDYVSLSTTGIQSINTTTNNDLFGPQLGGEVNFFVFPCCWMDFEFKGAICGNRALQDTRDTLVSGSQGRDTTSFVGDLDLSLKWKMSCHWMLDIGYQAVWVQNLALASRNFDQPVDPLEPRKLDTIGRAVYHGPHIGLEFMW